MNNEELKINKSEKDGKLAVYVTGITNERLSEAFNLCLQAFMDERPKCFNPIVNLFLWDIEYGDILPEAAVMIREKD